MRPELHVQQQCVPQTISNSKSTAPLTFSPEKYQSRSTSAAEPQSCRN